MSLGRQIGAARALLRWSASDLASATGLTRDTIHKIEADAVHPRSGTIKRIFSVFTERGIQLTPHFGAQLVSSSVDVLTNQDSLTALFDEISTFALTESSMIMQVGTDEAYLEDHCGEPFTSYMARMNEISMKKNQRLARALIFESKFDLASGAVHIEYRHIGADLTEPAPFYVFGNNIGIISFQPNTAPACDFASICSCSSCL